MYLSPFNPNRQEIQIWGGNPNQAFHNAAYYDWMMRNQQYGPNGPGIAMMPPRAKGAGRGKGGGGGGGGGGGMYQQLWDQYQQAQHAARMENLNRYQDILGGYAERYRRGRDAFSRSGEYTKQDIRGAYRNELSRTDAEMRNRGIQNTTVGPVLRRGVIRAMNRDLGAVDADVSARRTMLDSSLSGDMLQFMERRTDSYPDLNQMMQLAQMAGQAGAGYQGRPMPGGGGRPRAPRMQGFQANLTPPYNLWQMAAQYAPSSARTPPKPRPKRVKVVVPFVG